MPAMAGETLNSHVTFYNDDERNEAVLFCCCKYCRLLAQHVQQVNKVASYNYNLP